MEILFVVFAVLALLLLATAGSIGFLVWAMMRANRVSPSTSVAAPLIWLCSPSTPARTHRRLRTAAAAARRVPRQPDAPTHSRSALSIDLEQQAVALDQWVVWTSNAPTRWRRDHYRSIRSQVGQLETLTMRLTSIEDSYPHASVDESGRALDEVAERLAQLEQAHAEVQAIERLTLGASPLPAPAHRPLRAPGGSPQ